MKTLDYNTNIDNTMSSEKNYPITVERPQMDSVWLDDDFDEEEEERDSFAKRGSRSILKHSVSMTQLAFSKGNGRKNHKSRLSSSGLGTLIQRMKKSPTSSPPPPVPKLNRARLSTVAPISTPFNFNHIAHIDETESFGLNEAFESKHDTTTSHNTLELSSGLGSKKPSLSGSQSSDLKTHSPNHSSSSGKSNGTNETFRMSTRTYSTSSSSSCEHLPQRKCSVTSTTVHPRHSIQAFTTQPLGQTQRQGSKGLISEIELPDSRARRYTAGNCSSGSFSKIFQFPFAPSPKEPSLNEDYTVDPDNLYEPENYKQSRSSASIVYNEVSYKNDNSRTTSRYPGSKKNDLESVSPRATGKSTLPPLPYPKATITYDQSITSRAPRNQRKSDASGMNIMFNSSSDDNSITESIKSPYAATHPLAKAKMGRNETRSKTEHESIRRTLLLPSFES